ncbi:hypothetical protein [Bacillus solimangrovi]|uniref:Uncharacterized protein n=1 Tax=Bacillus solimangrovi TaxID=1305675 RepID=A0A1E5LJ89_9BACI|nr:hypothetical protein [Bacillus solimangrovi]OEH94106.1 hypothetical protein BFG57_09675 [Bacillus solimangrovi]
MKKSLIIGAIVLAVSIGQTVLGTGVNVVVAETQKEVKSIHDYTKEEMEEWIDREADLKRLNAYPIEHDLFETLAESNHQVLYPTKMSDNREIVTEYRLNPVLGFMETYFNRDYRTIGNDFINQIQYYYKINFIYEGDYYYAEDLPKMFERFVKGTKDEKRIKYICIERIDGSSQTNRT